MDKILVADVALPIPIDKPLTYVVPPHLKSSVCVGKRVLVSVRKRMVSGVVVSVRQKRTDGLKLKPIVDLLDDYPVITADLLDLSFSMSEYYMAPLGDIVAAMSPPSPRLSKTVSLAYDVQSFDIEVMKATQPKKAKLLEAISKRTVTLDTLKRKFGGKGVEDLIKELQREGLVRVNTTASKRRKRQADSQAIGEVSSEVTHKLTPEQELAYEAIVSAAKQGSSKVFLLHGVTGSGKTEVYLHCIRDIVAAGRKAVFLVPEIGLTPQVLARVRKVFGERCAVLHSRMSKGDRYLTWIDAQRGNIDVIVGPRSAVFTPFKDIGIIVVDEEHDPSYKQEDSPRYSAKHVALMRAKQSGAVVILGSATPTVESYFEALENDYELFELKERIGGGKLPAVEIVDMKGKDPHQPLSDRAKEAIRESIEAHEQVVLFLNRRGYSNFVQCRDCGFVPRCSDCQVTLTYHLRGRELVCHYCDRRERAWDTCPKCGGVNFEYVGSGTQRIEQHIQEMFPDLRCARFDSDATRKKGTLESVLQDFGSGVLRLLIGTQMIAKGHDFKKVGLVVVVNADVTMNIPDFRSAERTFQILTQVAGRAGRGNVPGRVIIQTFNPDHHALYYVARHDFKGFYRQEIELRRELDYPPFRRLARIVVESEDRLRAEQAAKELSKVIDETASDDSITIVGPSRAPISRIKGIYRWHLLVKAKRDRSPSEFLKDAIKQAQLKWEPKKVRFVIDVDPEKIM